MSSSKYTNEYKQEVLNNGVYKNFCKIRLQEYLKSIDKFIDDDDGTIETRVVNGLYHDFLEYSKEYAPFDCCLRLQNSRKRKTKKVKQKITNLVQSEKAIFITLTFTDKVLSKTTPETRRRYVARYLKANAKNYAANVDYGGLNGREHYHAVVDNELDLSKWHKYGAIKVERVHTTENDLTRVAKYITKLTNHALKVKGENVRLIYSRTVV